MSNFTGLMNGCWFIICVNIYLLSGLLSVCVSISNKKGEVYQHWILFINIFLLIPHYLRPSNGIKIFDSLRYFVGVR